MTRAAVMSDRALFNDPGVNRPDPALRQAVRRAVLGGVLHTIRTGRGWSVDDAASEAGVAPMTWRRLEDGLGVRRRSLTSLDGMLGQPFGTVARALEDDIAMVTLSGLAGDLYAGTACPSDPAAYLDGLAERFRSGTAALHLAMRPLPPTPPAEGQRSALVLAAELVDRIIRERRTEALENAAAAILAALPDLAAAASGSFRDAAAAVLESSGDRTLQRAADEVKATE